MNSSSSALQRLIEYSGPYQGQVRLAIATSILNKIFDLAPPVLIGIAVDVVVEPENSAIARFGLTSVFAQLLLLTLLSALVWGLESAFQYAYERLWRNLAQTIQHDLRLDAYRHLQNLEIAYFEDRSTGELMAILNDDINQLERFLDVGANEVIQVATTVLVIGTMFLILAPEVAWMTIVPMPFIIWGSIAYQKFLAPRYMKVRQNAGFLNHRLANNLSGITTIKSFTAEEYEVKRVAQDSMAYRRSNEQAIAYSAAFIPLVRMLILLGFSGILLYGGLEVTNGNLAVGIYSTLVFMTQRLLWPLTRLGNTLDLCQRAMASTRRVMGLLDTPIAIHPGDTPLPLEMVRGEVVFEDVSFAYGDRLPVLNHVSFTIPAGKTIAIVGSTGSGKSTLVKLLLRLYEVQNGTITLDGLELQTLQLEDLRRCMGLVSQDVFLFHGTVAENIAYGTFEASEPDIIAAATLAEAHDFIMELPQKYDTIVGERGQKLSGGQRQRLAIARAILKDPPILILDEATSAVDNETEAAIQRSLERITQNRTTIAIAHRLSTIRNAHCIHVMERGKVIESGRHEALLEHNGVYANLWRIQMGESMLTQ
ncbi:ABC transporter ATP-binding protein [Roseofilum sp. BLCC_M154]|uniref:ABC transporter ATP-binding protein n=1 Tax=Roseofilum acuticapitatum BLCC-M154 TaxID=3022444 RepID=A0ABT7AXE8_9CYAN|nr:ABC transporter ATP-binding protein [Roseofilum acuticapitatum]MDJ1171582.1 ABC transporter ATP-binding protein [Roseofilum acuticapitatum BLCC-M154]